MASRTADRRRTRVECRCAPRRHDCPRSRDWPFKVGIGYGGSASVGSQTAGTWPGASWCARWPLVSCAWRLRAASAAANRNCHVDVAADRHAEGGRRAGHTRQLAFHAGSRGGKRPPLLAVPRLRQRRRSLIVSAHDGADRQAPGRAHAGHAGESEGHWPARIQKGKRPPHGAVPRRGALARKMVPRKSRANRHAERWARARDPDRAQAAGFASPSTCGHPISGPGCLGPSRTSCSCRRRRTGRCRARPAGSATCGRSTPPPASGCGPERRHNRPPSGRRRRSRMRFQPGGRRRAEWTGQGSPAPAAGRPPAASH